MKWLDDLLDKAIERRIRKSQAPLGGWQPKAIGCWTCKISHQLPPNIRQALASAEGFFTRHEGHAVNWHEAHGLAGLWTPNADIKIAYGSNTTITMDLTTLASSATFVAGRESTQIDNTTNLFVDDLCQGKFIVGTTPTLPCEMRIYIWGADTSLATTAIDVLDGTDSVETLTNTTVLGTLLLAKAVSILVATSTITYNILPFSVGLLFGGMLPKFWGIYATHNMTAALATSAGNTNVFAYHGVFYTVI